MPRLCQNMPIDGSVACLVPIDAGIANAQSQTVGEQIVCGYETCDVLAGNATRNSITGFSIDVAPVFKGSLKN